MQRPKIEREARAVDGHGHQDALVSRGGCFADDPLAANGMLGPDDDCRIGLGDDLEDPFAEVGAGKQVVVPPDVGAAGGKTRRYGLGLGPVGAGI
jgi:hypothetical protein